MGAGELNCRVRNGNGWTLTAIDTDCAASPLIENGEWKMENNTFAVSHKFSIFNYPLSISARRARLRPGNRIKREWTLRRVCPLIMRGGRKHNCQLSTIHYQLKRSSPRPISTGQLNMLPCVHLRPINHVVFVGPYHLNGVGDLILGGVSRLDAFSVYLVRT